MATLSIILDPALLREIAREMYPNRVVKATSARPETAVSLPISILCEQDRNNFLTTSDYATVTF
ncbi:MAG: hypothetical protein PVH65_01890, partial [Chloroflexota bacterium]